MSILIDKKTTVLVTGITGSSGMLQTKAMLDAGTKIVAGVTPGKAGREVYGVPVYDFISDAKKEHEFDTVISFVPPKFAMDSCFEAIDAGIRLLVLTTEQIPLQEIVKIVGYARAHNTIIIGPGCAGTIVPGMCKVGSHPIQFFKPGNVGIVSKSGALSYEIGKTLSDNDIGQSQVVAIGGGPIWGFTQKDAIQHYEEDPDTKIIVLLGEIGGGSEEVAAAYIRKHVNKPVVALIVGRNAPKGKNLGHAGAIVTGNIGTATTKIAALNEAGAIVVKSPADLVKKIQELEKQI
ncbi:MAG: succinate--CoA ligase subunit alpha [Eubacteriaceae bacterium]|jgi:succinyl-CoA synthetase alpha subunit|nr:succinate--CoA ligase subunit alpha [Eubacteriaceae bacterium]